VPYQRMAYITGDDVTAKKPDPELFLTAAAAMNVPPDRCVVIEDAPNGVQAARAAGCGCIAVTNSTTAENLSSADLVVSSIETIRPADLIEIVSGRHT
ncbi:MAG: HAD family phosphatase, partial [Candidatus Hydrogenedentes bacterium]|nr:HAD family phosphatase [Candidatus Hydrogenedentota bacterium]